MAEIRVPALGESVTEATIGKWFKKPGDPVAADEPLVELETDKVTIEVPAPPLACSATSRPRTARRSRSGRCSVRSGKGQPRPGRARKGPRRRLPPRKPRRVRKP